MLFVMSRAVLSNELVIVIELRESLEMAVERDGKP
jgi:hypothetical protein